MDPKYVVLAILDEPSIPFNFGSNTAAPLVRQIIKQMILLKNLPATIPTIQVTTYPNAVK